ncbi:TonB-dependent receptor [Aeromonas veronii]|uniref:TonB-dependent receptor n=1 Tax=Aeromonas veronii TaxID=654 RepID=UPI001431DFD3|nr:TonB-dependent receptor [Aeromonas veronii]MBM0419327.1 TonB-dependent receptor [Aeromonas veronii]MBW3790391.1 TonB-dependent receptor [Aeromonas veronii]NJI20105.1 TonB-dependent receptor [Aeromonas veronii]
MLRKSRISAAIAFALASLAAAPSVSAEEGQNVEKLQKIKVTGSRISTTQVEGPSPVTMISAKDIEARGFNSAADILGSLSQNSGVMNQTNSFSFTPAAQSVNLRGLGAGKTLVLVDGRRLPQYPLAQDGSSNFTDIGQIPVAAIERVEILTDAGSAIYGSDAIGGVVNFILKKDFDGVAVKAKYGDTTEGGYQHGRVDMVAGSQWERARTMVVGQFSGNDILKNKDRDWAGLDKSDRSAFGNFSSYGANFQKQDGTLVATVADCTSLIGENAVKLANGKCGYNRAGDRTLKPEDKQYDLMGRGEYDITDNVTAMAELRWGTKETNSQFEPNPLEVKVSATDPGNPYGQEGSYVRRLVEFGPRQSNTTSDAAAFTTGLTGTLADKYEWEAYAGYATQDVSTDNPAVLGTLEDAVRQGDVDLFQRIDPATVAKYSGNSNKDASTKLWSFNSALSGDLVELPAGTSGFALAAEWTNTDYSETTDDITKAGGFSGLGGTEGGGKRDQVGLGGELLIPMITDVEMTLAGRYDRYFDDSETGGAFTPKVAITYRPIDTLLLRGSWGQGFKAPDMKRLFGGSTQAFGSSSDLQYCLAQGGSGLGDKSTPAIAEACGTQYYDVVTGPNKALKEERSNNYNLGLAWEPIERLGFTVDYYYIDLEDIVDDPDRQKVINNPSQYPGSVVERDANGKLVKVSYGPVNMASEKISGLDFKVKYSYETDSFGIFRTSIALTRELKRERIVQAGESAVDDLPFTPKYKGNWELGWGYGDLTTTLFANYRDRMCSSYANNYYFTDCEDAKAQGFEPEIASFTTWNLTMGYQINEAASVTLGAVNLFDKTPPADRISDTAPYFANDYDNPIGRTVFVEGNYKF